MSPISKTGVLLLALSFGAACGAVGRSSPYAGERTGSATIFAAASLTEPFTELKAVFERDNPGATLRFNFGSSSGLAAQIVEQGGADAFASADRTNMAKVVEEGYIEEEPTVFATNRLQIVVQPGNPQDISGLSDLADPRLKVVLAAAQVPVGRYAQEALEKAGVTVQPVSEAADVKGVVGPVTLGEADAGIVYASDVRAAGERAAGVRIPDEHNVTAEYPIANLRDAANREVAAAFVDLVLSDVGRRVLTEKGFGPPR